MTARRPWLVIPVKAPAGSKQRLAAAVTDQERILLSSAMARRVVRAAAEVWPLSELVVVTTDPELRELCAGLQVASVADPGSGQTAAVRLGVFHCLERGARVVATLAADLPQLRSADLEALLAAARRMRPGAVLEVPDLGGSGTNGLVVSPAQLLLHSFGPGSRDRHRRLSAALGLRWGELLRDGLALDLDRPADLERIGGSEMVLLGASRAG